MTSALLLLAAAASSSCATTSLERRDWQLARTAHFEIRSSLPPAATGQLARDLEGFALACEALLGASLVPVESRIRVYAHDGKGLERPFGIGNQAAWFRSTPEGGLLVLRAGGGFADAGPDTRFALARYLGHGAGTLRAPLWYDEGVSALLSTARPGSRDTRIGDPRFDLIDLLGGQVWPPTREILSQGPGGDRGRRDRALFRARAWAVVHFASLGPLPGPGPRAALDLKTAQTGRAQDTAAAWFGVPDAEFDPALRGYVSGGLSRERLAVRPSTRGAPPATSPMRCDEVGNALGHLALELERDGLARRYFARALACDEASARAHSGLALAESRRGRTQVAAEHRSRALSLAPDDPGVRVDVARSFDVESHAAGDDRGEGARMREAARKDYVRASELDPLGPAPLVFFARSILNDPHSTRADDERALALLMRAGELLPGSLEVLLDQARAHAELGEGFAARAKLEAILSRGDDPALLDAAAALLEWMASPDSGPRP